MLLSNGDSRETKSDTLLTVKPETPNASEEDKGPSAEDIASVITQVTARDQGSYRPFQQFRTNPAAGRTTWRTRVKSILCCFSPDTPYRRPETDVVNVRQTAPINTQPRVYKEYVIASKLEEDMHKKTLVLDLDETLVHSSFKPIPNPDYILPVEIDGKLVDVYVLKRPWLDHFMLTLGPRFEIVVFTASLAKYADPLLDMLDKGRNVRHRLFREACVICEGNYVKDLNCLGRDLADTIIVDNSPHSYVFQPENAVPIGTFIDNMEDQELLQCLKMLLCLEQVSDVREYITKNIMSQYQNQRLLQSNGYQKIPSSS